jgi:(p)ppGpp synthase/HD superfamily hydrolase
MSKSSISAIRDYVRFVLIERIRQEDFEDVLQTARLAHMGQTRRDGTPYISHPIAVSNIVKTYYPNNFAAQILALLHDTIEDGPKLGNITEEELRQIIRGSITDPRDLENIEQALDLMTHDKSVFPIYSEYLENVFSNPLASVVKIADLIHNLSHNPSARQIKKYRDALSEAPPPTYINSKMIGKLYGILNRNAPY